jgi:putative Mg2+ transporter-C (MgtC) family protein
MTISPEDIIKIFLALLAGGLIGMEREFRDKAAGFRTIIFICVGSCLFTLLSARLASSSDPNRIAANIVTGVGFLGAGVILRDGGKVIGLTTASIIWFTAAIGMGIGGGEYVISAVTVLVGMVVLWLLPYVEHRIDNAKELRKYEVVCAADMDKFIALENNFRNCGLKIQAHNQIKHGGEMTCAWLATGSPRQHEQLVKELFADPGINEFKY